MNEASLVALFRDCSCYTELFNRSFEIGIDANGAINSVKIGVVTVVNQNYEVSVDFLAKNNPGSAKNAWYDQEDLLYMDNLTNLLARNMANHCNTTDYDVLLPHVD